MKFPDSHGTCWPVVFFQQGIVPLSFRSDIDLVLKPLYIKIQRKDKNWLTLINQHFISELAIHTVKTFITA